MPKSSPARLRAQAKYNKKPSEVRRRVNNNRARRQLMREGRVRVGDGKDVAHEDNNHNNGRRSNLKVQSRSKNRSFKRDKNARRRK